MSAHKLTVVDHFGEERWIESRFLGSVLIWFPFTESKGRASVFVGCVTAPPVDYCACRLRIRLRYSGFGRPCLIIASGGPNGMSARRNASRTATRGMRAIRAGLRPRRTGAQLWRAWP